MRNRLSDNNLKTLGLLNIGDRVYHTVYEVYNDELKYVGGATFLAEFNRQHIVPIKLEPNYKFRILIERDGKKGWSRMYNYTDLAIFEPYTISEGANLTNQKLYTLGDHQFLIKRSGSDPNTIRIYARGLFHPTVDIHYDGHYLATFYKNKISIKLTPMYSNHHILDLDSIRLVKD